jgi:hypothetical protein
MIDEPTKVFFESISIFQVAAWYQKKYKGIIMHTLSTFAQRLFLIVVATMFGLLPSAQAVAAEAAQIVFVAGDAKVSSKAATLNATVSEGAEVSTGADGFVYLKTIDNGFLIVRPNSVVRIIAYQIDKAQPQNTRIKLELVSGVVRSISGDAVKLARQNFRFNTPVAAIGVRGTDFTVFTDQAVSRVTVTSGGVVVSGFGGSCVPTGNGPCEGGSSVELFAAQQGKLLQIQKDQMKPTLFNSGGKSPDTLSPPRSDEPASKLTGSLGVAAGGALIGSNDVVIDPLKNANLPSQLQATQTNVKALENSISWGRWATLMDKAPTLDLKKQEDAQAKLIAASPYYAVFQSKSSEWKVPVVGGMGFALKGGEAIVIDERLNAVSSANLENGKLQIDFASASFTTGFDLVTKGERIAMQAQGVIAPDGQLFGNGQYSHPTNMAVSGVVTAEKGGSASYIFQRRLEDARQIHGITYWGK